jgi:hypothetical protein
VYSASGQVTVRVRTTGFDGGAAEASRTLTVDPPAVAQDLEGPTLRFLGRLATLTPGGILTFRIGCAAAEPTPCAGPVTVQTATAVLPAARRRRVIRLGRTRFSVQPGRVRTVRVRLSRKSMRLVRVRNLKRVRVVALPRDLAGNVKRNEKVFRLRLQRRG